MASNHNTRHLQELGDSKYEIADGQPDIRGWIIRDINGKRLGEVDELIFDIQSRKVRYIVLDLEDNEWNLEEREVLIPIGLAELHENQDTVILRNVSVEQLKALPEYDDDNLDTNVETVIRNIFSGTGASFSNSNMVDADFYTHEHFNNNLHRNRSTIDAIDEHVRMRQEPSFLESEGSNHREIDNDVDEMRDQKIEMEERDAIPVTNSTALRAGNDIDESDITDDNTPRHTNTDNERNQRTRDDWPNRPSSL